MQNPPQTRPRGCLQSILGDCVETNYYDQSFVQNVQNCLLKWPGASSSQSKARNDLPLFTGGLQKRRRASVVAKDFMINQLCRPQYLRPNNNMLPNQTGSVPKTRHPFIHLKVSQQNSGVEHIAFIQGASLSESKQDCGENIAHFICIVKGIKRGFPLLQRIFSGEVNAQNIETLRRRLQMFLRWGFSGGLPGYMTTDKDNEKRQRQRQKLSGEDSGCFWDEVLVAPARILHYDDCFINVHF